MDHCYAGEEYSKLEFLCDLIMILFIPPIAVYLKIGRGRSNPVSNLLFDGCFEHIYELGSCLPNQLLNKNIEFVCFNIFNLVMLLELIL